MAGGDKLLFFTKAMNTDLLFSFSDALLHLKNGCKVARKGWNARNLADPVNLYVEAQFPDEHSKMGRPYLFIVASEDSRVPWIPSQTDLFADDWFVTQE